MSWSSPGRGNPITFLCAKCRSTLRYKHLAPATAAHVQVGRIKTNRKIIGRMALSPRMRAWSIEYQCDYCCHGGWSSHDDLARKFEMVHGLTLPEIPPAHIPSKALSAVELKKLLEASCSTC